MKILVVSDVHGNELVLKKILNVNKDADIKIYLGDFQMSERNQKKYTKEFDHVVTGNCDYSGISDISKVIDIDGKKVFITHGHYFGSMMKKIDFNLLRQHAKENNCEIVLHGHDHIAVKEEQDNIFRFNPGSTTLPRGSMVPTYGIIETSSKKWKFELISL